MLSLDGNVLVVFIIVWVLVLLLSKLFFQPVRRVRDKREKDVLENRESTRRTLESYGRAIGEIENRLREARKESEASRDLLIQDALKEKTRLLAEISAECRSQVATAREGLGRTVEELRARLEAEAEGLAERIEKKILH